MNFLAKITATCFYIGFFPLMPGTLGSILGVGGFIAARQLHWPLPWVLVVLIFVGIWSSSKAEDILRRKDPGEVIIDEVAGMFLVMLFIPSLKFSVIICAFVFFRVFDILKPPVIKRLQGLSGGVGIMADDILAGIYTIILLHVLTRFIRF